MLKYNIPLALPVGGKLGWSTRGLVALVLRNIQVVPKIALSWTEISGVICGICYGSDTH